MKKITCILSLLATVAISGCSDTTAQSISEKDACIQRGIQYFKEVGSYPHLSNGEDAEITATVRCSRTTTAF